MEPIKFTRYETTFRKDGCGDLPTKVVLYNDGGCGIISAWKPALIDRLRVLIGKPVYLVVMGNQQPPVLLSTDGNSIGATDGVQEENEVKISYGPETRRIERIDK